MGSLQRNASWSFTFLLHLSLLVTGADALAQAPHPDRLGPGKGGFDWTQFEGKYDLGHCRSRPSAIWGDGPPGTFVQIEHKVARTRDPATQGLDLMRANNRNPIALGWSTLQLRMDAQGRISFTIRQRTDSDAATREETCTLTRYVPKIPA